MRPHELRELDDNELDTHIQTQRRELFGLRFQHATGSLDDTAALSKTKRSLARALTVAQQRRTTTTSTED